jgi:DnaD/phage-associated family protein
MSQRKAKYITTTAFPEPNFTQVPNRFFDMLSEDMEASEVRVTLVMIRETYGYHRADFKMGIKKLAEAAGISRGAAKLGADAAEQRGTFRRSNPEEQGEAEWELVVYNECYPINECEGGIQPLYATHTTIDPQVGVKERNKEKESTAAEFYDHKVSSNVFAIYTQNIGALSPLLSDELAEVEKEDKEGWFEDAVKEALGKNVRNLKYIKAILARWKVEGRGDKRTKVEPAAPTVYKIYNPDDEPKRDNIPAPENLRRSHAAE